jgi:hypothetical protein
VTGAAGGWAAGGEGGGSEARSDGGGGGGGEGPRVVSASGAARYVLVPSSVPWYCPNCSEPSGSAAVYAPAGSKTAVCVAPLGPKYLLWLQGLG